MNIVCFKKINAFANNMNLIKVNYKFNEKCCNRQGLVKFVI